MNDLSHVSIILPAKNEGEGLKVVLPRLLASLPGAEVIVVDDGSTDETAEIVCGLRAKLVRHAYSKGNGAAIKSGARAASGKILVFMDADGQHKPEDVLRLLQLLDRKSVV